MGCAIEWNVLSSLEYPLPGSRARFRLHHCLQELDGLLGDDHPGGALQEAQRDRGGRVQRNPKGSSYTTPPSSSSIPAEAIQAEVQRQMGAILGRLSEMEDENFRLQSELDRERSRTMRAQQGDLQLGRSGSHPQVPASLPVPFRSTSRQ